MPTIRLIMVAVLNSTGWLALATLPSPWWRVVPVLLFGGAAILFRPRQPHARISFRELMWLAIFLVLAAVAANLLESKFGKVSLEDFVRSWPFALVGWLMAMTVLSWPWLRRVNRANAG